jgi:hypothetical protein
LLLVEGEKGSGEAHAEDIMDGFRVSTVFPRARKVGGKGECIFPENLAAKVPGCRGGREEAISEEAVDIGITEFLIGSSNSLECLLADTNLVGLGLGLLLGQQGVFLERGIQVHGHSNQALRGSRDWMLCRLLVSGGDKLGSGQGDSSIVGHRRVS